MIAQLLFVVSAFVAATAAPTADKYPAGLNPNLCPNYPHCDNALLAAHSQQQAGHASTYHTPASTYTIPATYAGYGSGHISNIYSGHSAGSYAAPGYPAGVDPSTCPNYPYCTNHVPTSISAPTAYHAASTYHTPSAYHVQSAFHAAPLPGFASRQYPDGVNPNTCPNYPFCH
ncbi:hypothetical protein RUM43_012051 [Polyplax serrata]|uniref:Cuticle protein CPCFC domain-containing protein n=1 Tax=Polyplax serrata TaxID=468196 RepID=A0AAN8RZM5_POLSC